MTTVLMISVLFGPPAVASVAGDGWGRPDDSVSLDPEPPERFVDAKGNAWVRVRRITDWARPGPVPEELDTPKDDVMQLTDEELAERLRPIARIGEYEYEAAEAPLQLARDIKSGAAEEYIGRGEPDTRGLPIGREGAVRSGPARSEEPGGPAPHAVIDGDGRELRRDNTTWPFSTHIVFLTGGCSATLIGASTATSVAHCFMNKSGQWYPLETWAPGADAQDANPFPFGTTVGCYIPVMRKGWKNTGKFTYDYAVVEFSDFYPWNCDLFPGDATGWLGWWRMPKAALEDGRSAYVYGYPVGKAPYPQIWGMGSHPLDVDGSDEIEYSLDTSGGQSGSGAYVFSSAGWRLVVGSHQGSQNPFIGGVRNRARRIDGSFSDLIKNHSAK